MIDVSIVIAAWNAEAFLKDSVTSALAQQDVSLEVIVCDDASTDATGDVARSFDDPRVRYLRAEKNGGPAAARNMGLAAAVGEWILVLDADDEMEPGRSRRLIDVGEATQAQIVADNFRVRAAAGGEERLHISERLDGGSETVGLAFYVETNLMFGDQPAYGYLKPIFRTDFLRSHDLRYPESMRIGEDFALVCEILVRGGRFLRSRSADYVYKTHSGSISHRLKQRDIASMLDYDRTFLAEHGAGLTGGERRAFERHAVALETAGAFTAIVDSLKEKRFGDAMSAAARRPQALRLLSMPLRARIARLMAKQETT